MNPFTIGGIRIPHLPFAAAPGESFGPVTLTFTSPGPGSRLVAYGAEDLATLEADRVDGAWVSLAPAAGLSVTELEGQAVTVRVRGTASSRTGVENVRRFLDLRVEISSGCGL